MALSISPFANIFSFYHSDQLRQRLVRMSVRHHEQLFSHQQREQQLLNALQECSQALEKAVEVVKQKCGPNAVPADINKTCMKFSSKGIDSLMDPQGK
jgi:hypothetical protein